MDLILGSAILFIVGCISAVIAIAFTGSREDGLGITSLIAIPNITISFLLIRKKLPAEQTAIQILLALIILFIWFKFIINVEEYFPVEELDISILIGSIVLILVAIKHSTDYIFVKIFNLKISNRHTWIDQLFNK